MSETGARPSELVGLLPDDIVLDADIPHISITDRKERPLKNPYSQRKIPMVGYALDAFKAMPGGFARYRDRPDSLTTAVNSFLRANKMLPTENHSAYSLRHSFQDRILKTKAPDRLQCDLMGHKFKDRIDYGLGSDMEMKLEYLEKAKLKSADNALTYILS